MKRTILAFLAFSFLNAQLVEKPTTKPTSPAAGKHSRPTQAVHQPTKPTAKDVLDKHGFPTRFQGYLADSRSGNVAFFFDGTWKKAPDILGGDGKAEWSGRGAFLRDMDDPDGANYFLISFNLGFKNGNWNARIFKWVKDDFALGGSGFKPSPLVDEGIGTAKDGVYTFEMESYRLVFWPSKGPWQGKDLHVVRFNANDFAIAGRPKPYVGSDAKGQAFVIVGPSQFVPVWAFGSYLVIEDEKIGRVVYRPFGDNSQSWIVRYAKEAGKIAKESTRYFDGTGYKDHATADFAGYYSNGLADFNTDASVASVCHVDLGFRDPLKLDEVRYSYNGKVGGPLSDPATLNSTLLGSSIEVPVPEDIKVEALSRSHETAWLASGGPYSPKRLMNLAYEGCLLQIPLVSMNTDRNGSIWNDKTAQGFKTKSRQWGPSVSESGISVLTRLAKKQKPYPLGLLMSKEEHKQYAEPACIENLTESGDIKEGFVYQVWMEIPEKDEATAFQVMARNISAQGYLGVTVNKELGIISAYQEMRGKKCPLNTTFTKKQPGLIRIEGTFRIPPGLRTTKESAKEQSCKLFNGVTSAKSASSK